METIDIKITGVENFDEQCRIQCAIQDCLSKLGIECNSSNFKITY